MLGRSNDIQVGQYMRSALEPMAQRLGLDQDETFFTPPTTDQTVAFYVYRLGLSLLMTYTYVDGWVQTDSTARSKRQAKRSAKLAREALVGPRGPGAISLMAQEYAHAMAELWTRAAETDDENRTRLLESARRAERVSDFAGDCWPVQADDIREQVAKFEGMRHFVPDNPDAMVDLRAYAWRARAMAIAVVFMLGDESDEGGAMLFRVMSFDMTSGLATLADWNFEGEHLANLLRDEPMPYREIAQLQNAAAMAR